GIQSVLSTTARTGLLDHTIETGVRLHYDEIARLHTESAFAMSGGVVVPLGEGPLTTADNVESTHAVAVHLTDAIAWHAFTLTPGARVEIIQSRSKDYLLDTDNERLVGAVMPGIGAHYAVTPELGILGGAYRGFSPPAPGSPTPVKPEYSVNYELG